MLYLLSVLIFLHMLVLSHQLKVYERKAYILQVSVSSKFLIHSIICKVICFGFLLVTTTNNSLLLQNGQTDLYFPILFVQGKILWC